jgi:negative regulator of sigma E activity
MDFTLSAKGAWQKTIKPKGNQNISSLARNPKLAQFEENKCRLLSDSE